MIKQTIARFKSKKLFLKTTADGLILIDPKKLKFYISPKIHKPNNSERPVKNSFKCQH